jgi:hypothetical protein
MFCWAKKARNGIINNNFIIIQKTAFAVFLFVNRPYPAFGFPKSVPSAATKSRHTFDGAADTDISGAAELAGAAAQADMAGAVEIGHLSAFYISPL